LIRKNKYFIKAPGSKKQDRKHQWRSSERSEKAIHFTFDEEEK